MIYEMIIWWQMGQAHKQQNTWCVFLRNVRRGIVLFLKKCLSVWRSEPAVKTLIFPVSGPCPLPLRKGSIQKKRKPTIHLSYMIWWYTHHNSLKLLVSSSHTAAARLSSSAGGGERQLSPPCSQRALAQQLPVHGTSHAREIFLHTVRMMQSNVPSYI